MPSRPNHDFFRYVSSDEYLPPISRWTTLGGLFLVSTFGVAVILAAVTKYNVTVKAPATVRPAGELRIAQASTEGTIKSIEVKENMVVKQGDAIAIVDDSQLQTQKSQLSGSIRQNQLQLTQLTAQINSLNRQRLAESQLMNRLIAAAQADLLRNQRDYQDRQVTTQSEVQQAEAELQQAQANLQTAQVELKFARQDAQRYQQLARDGAIPQRQWEEKELAAKAKALAVEQQKQVVQASQAKRQRSIALLNPSTASVAIAQEQIAQEKARGDSTLASLNQEQESLLQQKAEIQNQINRDRQQLQQFETELKKSVIRAPVDGTILQLNLRNPGQVVRVAEPIAQITPSNAPIVIKARVATQDIGKVALGQKSQMRVQAYPYPDYGVLNGKVSAIASDAITPQSNNGNASAPYYEVTIQPEKAYLVKSERQYPLEPGMEATAEIISNEETFLSFLLRKARLSVNFPTVRISAFNK
ncbi:MAG: HlyD family efflux transporter periplasmic adaptor subunit [Aphanothece sp. CMT-3BRIN-NPC111]|jgi:HlyD family secretion protein|nr:HlyD family efflux transporter periplasmic adaptor subunit [Aphanothece sp. CMT-3BRIN-NPC111]